MKKITPRIGEQSETFLNNFRTTNAGAEYILDATPALCRQTLHREISGRFTAHELSLILDVFNGTILTPGIAGQHLLMQCVDGMDLDRLDEKWEVDKSHFTDKLKSLTVFQAACLEIWASGFWCSGDNNIEKYLEGLV